MSLAVPRFPTLLLAAGSTQAVSAVASLGRLAGWLGAGRLPRHAVAWFGGLEAGQLALSWVDGVGLVVWPDTYAWCVINVRQFPRADEAAGLVIG